MPTIAIESCFQQLLRDNVDVVFLVSDRIHVAHRPQKDLLPSIVVLLNDYGDDPDIDNDETQTQPRVAVECYAASYYEAADVAQVVRDALTSHTGTVTVLKPDLSTYGTRGIDAIVPEDETADDTAPSDASDQRTYTRSILFFVLAYK